MDHLAQLESHSFGSSFFFDQVVWGFVSVCVFSSSLSEFVLGFFGNAFSFFWSWLASFSRFQEMVLRSTDFLGFLLGGMKTCSFSQKKCSLQRAGRCVPGFDHQLIISLGSFC